jgi:uncharacterized membrane protein
MQSVINYLKLWQPHPFVDHFTVALILLGIVADLVSSIFSARLWIRYMALSLMIAGAIGAAASNVTGGWEAHRVWESVNGPGKAVLQRHAWWGDILPWVFGALALWRLGSQFVGFLAATRPIYLLVAIVAGALIVYQGHLGSVMVYDYGIGTALLASQTAVPSPLPSTAVPAPEITNTPIAASPLPTPSPTPSNAPSSTPSPAASAFTTPTETPSVAATPLMTPSAAPTAAPSTALPAAPSTAPSAGSTGSPINPPPAESPSPGGGTAKNL